MAQAMAYKAADGSAQWNDGSAALAHATLHTTHESRTAGQPLCSVDAKRVVIFDGLLTNYEELRTELLQRKAVLRSLSDAELILGAYKIWGRDCVSRFDGEFAFVLWDGARKVAIAARDHQGLRPLVYAKAKDRIVIASDLATLNAGLGRKPEPNLDYLAQISAGQFYSPDQTAAKGVFRLLPAHSFEVSQTGISKRRYWSLATDVTIRYRRDEEYVEHYRSVLKECVRKSSRTDQPLALEVSGGLDSSATFCLAHQLFENGDLPAPEVRGYSLLGAAGTVADEIDFARSAARHVNSELREIPLFEPTINWFVEQARLDQDIPTYTNAAMSIALEEAMISDGCSVTMGGTGGDQWLDGSMDYYIQHLRSFALGDFLRSIARDVPEFGARVTLPFAFRQLVAAFLPTPLANPLRRYRHGTMDGAIDDCFWLSDASKRSLEHGFRQLMRRYTGNFVADRKRARIERAETQFALDLMNRQYSRLNMESRSPMFAKSFIEFQAATPEHIRFRSGRTKWVHRQAMRGIVPADILERSSKATFPSPRLVAEARDYCEANLQTLTDEICSPSGLTKLLTDSTAPEFDLAWPVYIWGNFAAAAYLKTQIAEPGCGGKHDDTRDP